MWGALLTAALPAPPAARSRPVAEGFSADPARRRFSPPSVTVLAGPGGNGGGGLVAARHLHNRGTVVSVSLASENLSPVTAHQLDILTRKGVEVRDQPGVHLPGHRRSDRLQPGRSPPGSAVLALDTPSGLDLTTGIAHAPCVGAHATMTLALPKVGLARAGQVGELFLADISVPPSLDPTMGLAVPPAVRARRHRGGGRRERSITEPASAPSPVAVGPGAQRERGIGAR